MTERNLMALCGMSDSGEVQKVKMCIMINPVMRDEFVRRCLRCDMDPELAISMGIADWLDKTERDYGNDK